MYSVVDKSANKEQEVVSNAIIQHNCYIVHTLDLSHVSV